jgi:N-acetylgalactosamine-6-sulfatase
MRGPFSDGLVAIRSRETLSALPAGLATLSQSLASPMIRSLLFPARRTSLGHVRFRPAARVACALLTALVAVVSPATAAPGAPRPNVIFILADDLGYGDLACYGARDIRTPHLDALARAGVRFTAAYSNGPECTPARTAFLTGRHPQRAGGMECPIGTGNVGRYDEAIRLRARNDLGLPPAQAVLAPALRAAGYANAVVGKWHMGYEPKFNPLDQGFDRFLGILGGNVDHYRHNELSPLPVLLRDRTPVRLAGYLGDLLRDEAAAFLRDRRPGGDPFFLYLALVAPHFPFQPPGRPDAPAPTTENWTKGTRADYVAMVEHMDAAIGDLLAQLERQGLARDTLVVFASDNGAMLPGSNAPFRDFKETLFEGGIRIPVIARWPASLPAGRADDRPLQLFDLTASLLHFAGAAPPATRPLDGHAVLADVAAGLASPERDFFWRARRGDRTWRAVRSGPLKFISRTDPGAGTDWLFDLAADPSEKNDLLAARPADAARLRATLARWEASVPAER